VADVRPFRAVRYARPTAEVTAPPYDVIDDEASAELRARDPHNIVHLTTEKDETVAAERLEQWLADGTLVRDGTPAVWFLEQDFVGPDGVARSRDGLVASLLVEPYSAGVVLPHERTHAEALEGRLRLVRATRTQLEPIFLLYEGPPPLERPDGDPDVEIDGTRLWRLEGDSGVETFFRGRQLLIADGHHRYEAAAAFAAEGGGDRMLVVLVSTEDRGLQVFPTHRVYTDRPEIDPPGDDHPSVVAAREALDREPSGSPAAVLVRSGTVRLVRGQPGELDVELVDRFGHDGIGYTPDADEAVRRVEAGEADCAFLLRPLRLEDVFERAREGRTMPQKATYFFPKLLSGILLHPLDP
jgi:uncharacterized protein (DUF1015 family)